MQMNEDLLRDLEKQAPRFESVAHAVAWIRWQSQFGSIVYTACDEPMIGYHRETLHAEIHLALVYMLAEQLYRNQHCDGV